jgi:hypothetical protein
MRETIADPETRGQEACSRRAPPRIGYPRRRTEEASMGGGSNELTGPDFEGGVADVELKDGLAVEAAMERGDRAALASAVR